MAVSGFIIALGVAVLAWYGIKKGERWALLTAFVVAVALPLHGIGTLGHLGLIYLDALILVVGTALAYVGLPERVRRAFHVSLESPPMKGGDHLSRSDR